MSEQTAIAAAKRALNRGDVAIGASLVIDGELVGSHGNKQYNNGDWVSHAETRIIYSHATAIKEAAKLGKKVELFTTLEPCMMCMGMILLNRITQVTYSLEDPVGGASNEPKDTKELYSKRWPVVKQGSMGEESYQMLQEFCDTRPDWKSFAEALKLPLN